MGLWIAAGLLLGIAFGIWTGQLFIAIFIGVAAGIGLGAGLSRPAPAQRTETQVDQVPSRVSNDRVEHLADDESKED